LKQNNNYLDRLVFASPAEPTIIIGQNLTAYRIDSWPQSICIELIYDQY